MELKDLSDEELVLMAQSQNSLAIDILLERYKSVAAARARAYFLNGGDEQDLVQEGMIAVFNAILNFNGKSNFKNYAFTAVNNRIISVQGRNNTWSSRRRWRGGCYRNNMVSASHNKNNAMDRHYCLH